MPLLTSPACHKHSPAFQSTELHAIPYLQLPLSPTVGPLHVLFLLHGVCTLFPCLLAKLCFILQDCAQTSLFQEGSRHPHGTSATPSQSTCCFGVASMHFCPLTGLGAPPRTEMAVPSTQQKAQPRGGIQRVLVSEYMYVQIR